jgi:hypothetical protein
MSSGKSVEINRGGARAIRRCGKSRLLVPSGPERRQWVTCEIQKAWKEGKGVLGVQIHSLRNAQQRQAVKGANPFADLCLDEVRLSSIVRTYNPPRDSRAAYTRIEPKLADWVEEAIDIRRRYS